MSETFEYLEHWYTKLFEVLISNGWFMDYVILLYLSGLNMMEDIDKEQWLRFPPKPKEAKLNIMGGDLFWILASRS